MTHHRIYQGSGLSREHVDGPVHPRPGMLFRVRRNPAVRLSAGGLLLFALCVLGTLLLVATGG